MSAVGIDLGTTYTVVGHMQNGRVQMLADDTGRRLLPSVVSFHPNGEVLVGQPARERRAVDSKNTIFGVKRLIGRPWAAPEIAMARSRLPFELKEGPGHGPLVVARGQEYTLPEISALVLRRARLLAEKATGAPVHRAVITVPASFNELQRASTKVAGRVAGLEVLRILNEPTAAALAYGLGKGGRERIAVYDFGGGTFDCTLIDRSGHVFEVLSTSGDSFLGGDDLDGVIAERLADALLVRHRLDARADPQVFERLRLAAEGIKIELSSADRVETRIRELGFGPGGVSLDLDFALTRSEFETLAAPLVERTLRVCKEAMTFAHLDVGSFERVVLVGGSVHIPFVRRRVEAFFRIAPTVHLNPEEVVAMGAAIQAAALSDATRVRSIPAAPTPRVQMHEPEGGPRPTPRISLHPKSGAFALDQIAQATERATLMSTPPPAGSSSVKVAVPTAPRMPSFPGFGEAARRGPSQPPPAVVSPVAPVLVDVTPRALVVETAGGFCDVVVARNSKIPCERSRGFATVQDGQTCVRVRVAQGEAEHFVDNFYLGEIELSGLRPAPRGEVLVIVVGFEVDANGTLKVRASEQATGLEARATLQLDVVSGDLSIARMQARAASIPMA